MLQKSIDKFERVQKQIDAGTPMTEALKSEKMGAATYYSARKIAKKMARKKPGKVAKSAHEFFDIATPQPGEQIAIVVCTVGNLKKVLGGLL